MVDNDCQLKIYNDYSPSGRRETHNFFVTRCKECPNYRGGYCQQYLPPQYVDGAVFPSWCNSDIIRSSIFKGILLQAKPITGILEHVRQ